MRREGRVPKYIWLPIILAIYFIGMMVVYAPELIHKGEYLRVVLVSAVEILAIILVYIFYKKKAKK